MGLFKGKLLFCNLLTKHDYLTLSSVYSQEGVYNNNGNAGKFMKVTTKCFRSRRMVCGQNLQSTEGLALNVIHNPM